MRERPAGHGCGSIAPNRLDDACLVLSELVSNALRHRLGDVVARASLDGEGWLVLSVTDSGDGHPQRFQPDPTRIGGVGLTVVDHLATTWGVAAFPDGKTVWAMLRCATAPP